MKKLASRKDFRVIDLMIAHGPLGYGIYALLVEYLKERKAFRSMDDIKRIAYELHADAETVRSVIEDFGLFTVDAEGIITHGVAKPAEPAEPSENSESSENSELSEPLLPQRGLTSSQKRRERRRKIKLVGLRTPAIRYRAV